MWPSAESFTYVLSTAIHRPIRPIRSDSHHAAGPWHIIRATAPGDAKTVHLFVLCHMLIYASIFHATVSNPRNTRINGQFILHASSPGSIKLNLTALCARRNDYTLRRMIHEARKKRRRMTILVARTQVQTLVHARRSDSITLTLFLQDQTVLTGYPRYTHVTLWLHSSRFTALVPWLFGI